MQKKAKQILQTTGANKLPTLPHVLLHLLDTCQDENISFEQLANVIRRDPALCVKIISTCGGDSSHEMNLEQSLLRLGIHTIKSIAITSAVRQFFSRNNEERLAFLKQHWYHAIYCGCIAEQIAEYTN
jgi:HD-like signal output (HDOD) protein